MWFKNALIYQVQNMPEHSELDTILLEHQIKPCPPHSRYIYGWLDALNGKMVHTIEGVSLFVMGKEERILPNSVINQMLEEKIQVIEAEEARTIRRSERNQMKEELEFTLLPKSFSIQKKTWAYYNAKTQYLIINSSSLTMGEQFCSLLRKSVKNIEITPLTLDMNLSARLTQCIQQPHSLPNHFDLGEKVVLQSPDDEKKRFNCKGYELPAEEIDDLLKRGLQAIELSFQYNEKLDFTLTHQMVLKNIKCRDLLLEELQQTKKLDTKEEEFDSSFVILATELNHLIQEVLQSLLSTNDLVAVKKDAIPEGELQKVVGS